MVDKEVASLRSVQIDDELEPDGCARSRAGKYPIAQITSIGVDADEIPCPGPVDGADVKSEVKVCLVRTYEERVEAKRIVRRIRRQGIPRVQWYGASPVCSLSVHDDGGVLHTGAHRDDAVVFLGV